MLLLAGPVLWQTVTFAVRFAYSHMTAALHQLYDNRAAYRLPVYSVRQAAHLTGLPAATVQTWTKSAAEPLIQKSERGKLSFLNLVELHVLAAIRQHHQVPLRRVRHAVDYVRQHANTEYPLAEQQFETDGVDLFVRALDDTLVNASRRGQVAIRELMSAYLKRIERAPDGFPLRLFPLYREAATVQAVQQAPAFIAVDPQMAFGRPFLVQGALPVDVVVSRYRGGDSIAELVAEYDLSASAVEEAIRYELGNAA